MARILNSNLGKLQEKKYLMKLKHRISFVGGKIIPANTELSKEDTKLAKDAGGKFHDTPKKAKKTKKVEGGE